MNSKSEVYVSEVSVFYLFHNKMSENDDNEPFDDGSMTATLFEDVSDEIVADFSQASKYLEMSPSKTKFTEVGSGECFIVGVEFESCF